MTSIIRVGQSQFVSFHIDEDSYDRIMQDLRVVGTYSQDGRVDKVFLEETKAAYAKQIQDEEVSTKFRQIGNSSTYEYLYSSFSFLFFFFSGGLLMPKQMIKAVSRFK